MSVDDVVNPPLVIGEAEKRRLALQLAAAFGPLSSRDKAVLRILGQPFARQPPRPLLRKAAP